MISALRLAAVSLAAITLALPAAPALADTTTKNSSSVRESAQSGNVFGDVLARSSGTGTATNVTSVNANTVTATRGGGAVLVSEVD
ncbi:hypothetical protein [Nonomuraea indica]|uniref:hypothetical protein n=1 Tax=Nonomuraea indica TaxID=1581193 RepID=UPI000C7DF44C|nr:hypothetical protein [Nonomuraea indica]